MERDPESKKYVPIGVTRDRTRELCEIEAVLDTACLRPKNHHWWNFREEYSLAESLVRPYIGTELRFEIVHKDGKRAIAQQEMSDIWGPVTAHSHVD